MNEVKAPVETRSGTDWSHPPHNAGTSPRERPCGQGVAGVSKAGRFAVPTNPGCLSLIDYYLFLTEISHQIFLSHLPHLLDILITNFTDHVSDFVLEFILHPEMGIMVSLIYIGMKTIKG